MSDAILPCPTFDNGEFQLAITPAGDSFRVQAPSLARALGFRDAFRLMESIPDSEKGYTTACTPGGEQRIGYLTEAGFYRALGQRQPSRIKDEVIHVQVERFQSWVYSEVLPAIRRRGGYLTPEAAEQALTDPDFIIRLATELKAERAARAELEQQRRVLVPKADAFDLWLSSNADYGVDQAAKALCAAGYMTGRTRLFRTLSELGWAFKARDGWRYTQEHGPEGTKRLTVRMSYYLDSRTGESHGRTTLRVTAKGVHDLATRLGVNPATVADTLTAEEVAS